MVCAPNPSASVLTPIAATATAVPVPISGMVCGEPGALLVIVIAPLIDVALSGVKVILNTQLPAGATGEPEIGQVLVKPKSPEPVIRLIVKPLVPLLVKVTVATGLVVFTVREPKFISCGDSVTAGTPGTEIVMVADAIFPVPTTLVPVKV